MHVSKKEIHFWIGYGVITAIALITIQFLFPSEVSQGTQVVVMVGSLVLAIFGGVIAVAMGPWIERGVISRAKGSSRKALMYRRMAKQFTFGFVTFFALVALVFAITSANAETRHPFSFMFIVACQTSVLAGVLNVFANGPPHDKEDEAA